MSNGIQWDDDRAGDAAPAPKGISWDDEPHTSANEAFNLGMTEVPSFGLAPRMGALREGLNAASGIHGNTLRERVDAPLTALLNLTEAPGETWDKFKRGYNDQLPREFAYREQAAKEHLPATIAGGTLGALLTGGIRDPRAIVAQGGAIGLGGSRADLGKAAGGDLDELKHAATDTTIGAAFPAVALGAGQALGALRGAIRGRALRGVEEAVTAEAGKQAALDAKAIDSQGGRYGQSVQAGSRDLEVMAREAANLPESPERDALLAYLNSEDGLALRKQVAMAKLESAPQRVAEIKGELGKLEAMKANSAENVAANTEEALKDPGSKHIWPRVMTLGSRALPFALGVAGHAVGGNEGAAWGAGLGTLMSITQGAPGRIIKNLMKEPSARKVFWERVLTGVGGASPESGFIVQALERAAQRGPVALGLAAKDIAETSELGRSILQRVAQESSAPDDSVTMLMEQDTPEAKAAQQSRAAAVATGMRSAKR